MTSNVVPLRAPARERIEKWVTEFLEDFLRRRQFGAEFRGEVARRAARVADRAITARPRQIDLGNMTEYLETPLAVILAAAPLIARVAEEAYQCGLATALHAAAFPEVFEHVSTVFGTAPAAEPPDPPPEAA